MECELCDSQSEDGDELADDKSSDEEEESMESLQSILQKRMLEVRPNLTMVVAKVMSTEAAVEAETSQAKTAASGTLAKAIEKTTLENLETS